LFSCGLGNNDSRPAKTARCVDPKNLAERGAATTVIGLARVFLDTGRGWDVMQPMAIPSVGGMAVQLITVFVAPCLYYLVKEWQLRFQHRASGPPPSEV